MFSSDWLILESRSEITTAVFLLSELDSIGWLCLTYLLSVCPNIQIHYNSPETFDLACMVNRLLSRKIWEVQNILR